MRALVLVGHALLRHDRAIAARQAVDHRCAYAARGRPTGDDERIAAMEVEERAEIGLVKGGGHALVDNNVASAVNDEAVVELRPAGDYFDVIQVVGRTEV